MKQSGTEHKYTVRDSHFPVSIFGITLLVLLLMSGVHFGILVLLDHYKAGSVVSIVIIILYWVLVSVGFTFYTNWQMRRSYETPMKKMAEAADLVAHGDFSVYIPPIHTVEKMDYLDVMFMNFNKMVEELGSIETLKTDFFSNVSHEIKTPIAVIQNSAEMLQSAGLSEMEKEEYVTVILQSSKKLSGLITNILKINKLEKQNIQPVDEEFDLCGQLCDCALQFEDIWVKKEINFDVDIEDKVTIKADASLLELVWTNLLSNAIKFTNPGGTVCLKQTSTDQEIIVSISDTGCGMTEESMNHIFDKFYQGDTSHSTEGNGLGLALALRIVQIAEGTIMVESEPGKGTVFTVTLPVNRKRE